MNIALSVLLAEYIDAVEAEHADTAGFQIVCPCCRESVLKVSRTGGDGRPFRYVSHRHMPPEEVECELRVSSVDKEAMEAFNGAAPPDAGPVPVRPAPTVALDGSTDPGTTAEKAY